MTESTKDELLPCSHVVEVRERAIVGCGGGLTRREAACLLCGRDAQSIIDELLNRRTPVSGQPLTFSEWFGAYGDEFRRKYPLGEYGSDSLRDAWNAAQSQRPTEGESVQQIADKFIAWTSEYDALKARNAELESQLAARPTDVAKDGEHEKCRGCFDEGYDVGYNEAREVLSRSSDTKEGVSLIAVERARQINVEGYTAVEDERNDGEQLAVAAALYATPARHRDHTAITNQHYAYAPKLWPWDVKWWKPTPHDRIRELVKAGALIAAEIDRLLRSRSSDASTQQPAKDETK